MIRLFISKHIDWVRVKILLFHIQIFIWFWLWKLCFIHLIVFRRLNCNGSNINFWFWMLRTLAFKRMSCFWSWNTFRITHNFSYRYIVTLLQRSLWLVMDHDKVVIIFWIFNQNRFLLFRLRYLFFFFKEIWKIIIWSNI